MLLQSQLRASTLQRCAARAAGHRATSAAAVSPLRFSATRVAAAACAQSPLLTTTSTNAAHFSSTARERFASSYSKRKEGNAAVEKKPELNVSRIAVIGGGNMAEAIITGVLSQELLPREKLIVSDPNPGEYVRQYDLVRPFSALLTD